MSKYFILYNAKSGSEAGKQKAEEIEKYAGDAEVEYIDVTKVDDFAALFEKVTDDDTIVLCGGDGTLCHFANDTYGMKYPKNLLFYSAGTGNDFYNDIGKKPGTEPVPVAKYLEHLPTVTVKGKDYKFINGIGYGIDGYCCEVGDAQHAAGVKEVNYTSIAIKGLLFHFKPKNATVTVDGVTKKYKKAWLAPTMNGRYYGGGMIPTPDQDRLNNETVSVMVMYGKGKIKTLMVFPSIFKGEHINHKEMVDVLVGKEVKVEFDSPCALQIDGETILDVSGYTVKAYAPAKVEEPAAAL
ncbi:MAG: diacylglycerol kinase family protein [Clostridia bacterium]|nr:diacylglycerol kinase family protein [Clostridia bacterium]